ncbi:MAG TPA: hypothetical protein ENK61_03145, partial [Devosia sp.]|nr:hypothetical protein [Devosia sp.]
MSDGQLTLRDAIYHYQGDSRLLGEAKMTTQKNTHELRDAALKRVSGLKKTKPELAKFLSHVYSATDEEDLGLYSGEQFDAILAHSYARFAKRNKDEHLIHIWKADEKDPRGPLIIDIFMADMPFVVDSVLGAIRAKGSTVRMFVHPVLPVDKAVKPWKILDKGDKNSGSESFLQVHIDPISDEVALAELYTEIDGVLMEVGRAVRGWRPMLERLKTLIQSYRQNPPDLSSPVIAETLHFLAWLADHNFTFLGMREYALEGKSAKGQLKPVKNGGLGILEDPEYYFLRKGNDYVEMTDEHRVFWNKPDPIMVTKANIQARVHRRGHLDYIGVKLFDESGKLTGELRMVGLFTSMSLATPHTEVPLVRRKVSEVMRMSKIEPGSHAG